MIKNLKAYIVSASLLVVGANLNGQRTLVAGFDFSQFLGSGFNSTDGQTFTGVATANYSDFITPSPSIEAAPYGNIYWDGQFGSTDGEHGFDSTIKPASGSLMSAKVQTSDLFPFDSLDNLKDTGQTNTQLLSLGIQQLASASIVFSADLTMASEVGSDWQIKFAAKELQSGQSSTITWEVSTDGSSYSPVGTTTTTTSVDTAYTVSAGAFADGSAKVYFRANYAGIATQTLIDNVGISAALGASGGSYWSSVSATSSGWRYTGFAGDGEPGMGWIWDVQWPWVYTYAFGDGDWMYVYTGSGDRNGFYAYNNDLGFWIYGVNAYGWYYSFESGSEGWKPFNQ